MIMRPKRCQEIRQHLLRRNLEWVQSELTSRVGYRLLRQTSDDIVIIPEDDGLQRVQDRLRDIVNVAQAICEAETT